MRGSNSLRTINPNVNNNNNNNHSNTITLPRGGHDMEEVAGATDTIYLCNFRVSVDGEWLCLKELQNLDIQESNNGGGGNGSDESGTVANYGTIANNKSEEITKHERDWVNYCRLLYSLILLVFVFVYVFFCVVSCEIVYEHFHVVFLFLHRRYTHYPHSACFYHDKQTYFILPYFRCQLKTKICLNQKYT